MRRSSIITALGGLLLCSLGCEPAPADDEAYEPPVQLPPCDGNNDGVITRAEMPFVVGAAAKVRVTEGPVDIDVTGREDDDGNRVWDFTRPDPGDDPVATMHVREPGGFWFDEAFDKPGLPEPDLVGPLDPAESQLGPLVVGAEEIALLGAASAEEDPAEGQTLVVYDEPVVLYAFPLEQLGTRVSTEAKATDARLLGLPVAFEDIYDVEVTDIGSMILPDLVLENTLRVTVRLERTLIAGDARQTTHVFVHECLGEVARVSSQSVPLDEELDDEFESAAQLWRISL